MSSSGKRVRTTVARQRSTLLRGLSATLSVTVLAGAAMLAAAVGTATVANAAAPGTLTCNTGGNGASFSSTWNDTNTFTLSPASVEPGGTETVTWTSATGLVNGSPVALGAGSTQVQVVVALSGAMSGNVVATTTAGAYPAVTTASESPLGPITATGTFTTSGSGSLNATVSFIDFNSNSVDTYCSASTSNTQFPAAGSALVSYINSPGFQTPTGLPTPGDAGTFATSNPNYGDLQVSAGATAFGSASATIAAQSPGAPTGVTGVGGDGKVAVSWHAPADTGGSAITGYTVTSAPDSGTCTAISPLSCTVSGLNNGTAYTFTVTATNTVGTSVASAPSAAVTPSAPTAPGAPTGVTGVGGDGKVAVSWVAPADTGGSAITGYTVTSAPDSKTCTAISPLSCTVSGLNNGTAYTFTVTATNTVGTSVASAPSAAVTPSAPTAPGAPTGVTGVGGDGKVAVSWVAPADTGGSAITGYTVTSAPDSKTCTAISPLSCTVSGLNNGTAYTFTVTATNTVGTSVASAPSAAVTPSATSTPPNSLVCNTGNNSSSFQTTYSDTMTYTLSPASATAGDTVTATYGGAHGVGNAAPVTLYKGTVQVQAVVALSGAMSGTVVAVTTPGIYPAANIPPPTDGSPAVVTPMGVYTASTTFTATGSGTVTGTVTELILKGGLDTYCSPATGNYPGASDPTITSTLLSCYLPDWQANSATITYDNGQLSGTATSFASANISVTGSTPTPTTTDCPTPTPTNSTSSSPTTTASAPPISANVPSTVTKQVSGIYCQIFTSQNGILWNGPADPQNPASKSVAAPYFTVSMTPQVPKAGQKVTITVKYNVGNGAGPSDIPVNADKLRGVVQLSGSLTSQVIVSSATLPAFAGSSSNPNSRVPSLPMVGTFTFPSTPNAVVYASLLTTADDDGNPVNIGNSNGDPTKPDTFNWPKVSDLFDVVCNKSLTAKLHPLTPTSGLTAAAALVQPQAVVVGTIPAGAIGVTAGVPYYGTVTTPTTTESSGTTVVVSGDTLPHTGASGVVGAGIVAAIVIQLGMILYVRSVRAVPVRRPSHA